MSEVPRTPPEGCTVAQLQALLRELPSLGEDAEAFARDVLSARESIRAETSAWDDDAEENPRAT